MERRDRNSLHDQIRDLLHASIRAYDVGENDAVSLRTLKLFLVGNVLDSLGLDWAFVHNLFKNHTPVHPDVARVLVATGDEEVISTVAQGFVRNEKLARMLRVLTQHGVTNLDRLLAVDGLSGNLPNYDQKNYVGNLKYGEPKTIFDTDPEYRRLHVKLVREMYDRLGNVPVPPKQIYEILRLCFAEMAKVTLPETNFKEDEEIDTLLLAECGRMYMMAMGKDNIVQLVKGIKKLRGEKRTRDADEREKEEEKEK